MAHVSEKDLIRTISLVLLVGFAFSDSLLSAVSSGARRIDSDPIIDNRGGGR